MWRGGKWPGSDQASIELSPDVILTDVKMPVMDGIMATRELARRKINNRVIVLSAYGTEEPILQMLEAGALGYIFEKRRYGRNIEAIYTNTGTTISAKRFRAPYRDRFQKTPVATSAELSFSERKRHYALICREYTSKEIAHSLNLSKRTVEGHRTRIMDKIGAKVLPALLRTRWRKIYQKDIKISIPRSSSLSVFLHAFQWCFTLV